MNQDKLWMTISSTVKRVTSIFVVGIVLNLWWILFLVFFWSNFISRSWITLWIILSLVFPFVYIFSLKTKIMPLVVDSIFRSYQDDLDEVSTGIANQLVHIRNQVSNTNENLSGMVAWVIKRLSNYLLWVNTETLFNSLTSWDPHSQMEELQTKLRDVIEEKIQKWSSERSIVVRNVILIGWLFVLGIII